MSAPEVAIVGGGPAGLAAAETLAAAGRAVTVYERMPSVGRKFLMAGRGGLNLTHGEAMERFLDRYGEARPALEPAIAAFPPQALRAWAEGLGEPTFVGTSGRVFPQSFKASPLLRAWLRRLETLGVRIATRHRWTGWDTAGALLFETPQGSATAKPAATLLALGGASWPRLGADGGWAALLAARGIPVSPLRPANCGVLVGWSAPLRERFAGEPLKRIALSAGGRTERGEAVVTRTGLEGGVVYRIAPVLREALRRGEAARLSIDLRPDASRDELAARLARGRPDQSLSTLLRKALALPPVAVALIREAAGGPPPRDPAALAALVKHVGLAVTGVAGLDRAISTAGGVAFAALDAAHMLRSMPGVFVAGEMLDWEAPTGGYLLQACFATGIAAAAGIEAFLRRDPGDG